MPNRHDAMVLGAICMLTLPIVHIIDQPPWLSDLDIFFMEAALAVGLGFIVYRYSQQGDRALQSHLGEVKSMLERGEKTRQIKRARAGRALRAGLGDIARSCRTLAETGDKSAQVSQSALTRLAEDFSVLQLEIKAGADGLRRRLADADYLDDRTHDDISSALDCLDEARPAGGGEIPDATQYRTAADLLDPVLLRLERRAGAGAEPSSSPAGGGRPDRLGVSLDRDIYPPGAAVRVTVSIDGPPAGKKATVSILDEGLAVLEKKTMKAPPPGAPASYTVHMRPRGMAAGRVYVARAVCGGLVDEATFAVDHIPPAVETDKSVYLMDEDMIVTVVDPAASGGAKGGHVGDGKKSKLTVESPHGKIGSYRLKETDTPGVFQGLVRCMGIYADGSPRGTVLDNSYVDRTQGKGPEDGVIACGPGQMIKIKYAAEHGTASADVFVGAFGSAIELDRDEYSCLSSVDICVVMPDYVLYEGEDPSALGDDRNDCWLSVSTSEGSLDGYRLAEREPGSGIFEGRILLTGLASMEGRKTIAGAAPCGRTGGTGPLGGTLACAPEDTLTVALETAFSRPVRSETPVRWRIGEVRFSKAAYRLGEEVAVRVADADMSVSRGQKDRFPVRVQSDSDREGIAVDAIETARDSGVFEGRFVIRGGRSDPNGAALRAAGGDAIRASYDDETLPPPHGGNDRAEISASALVEAGIPASLPARLGGGAAPDGAAGAGARSTAGTPARLEVDRIDIRDIATGGVVLAAGEAAEIFVRVKNLGGEAAQFAAIVDVGEPGGAKAGLAAQQLAAGPNGYATHAFSWTPGRPGIHGVRMLLREGRDSHVQCPHPIVYTVQVAGGERGGGAEAAEVPPPAQGGRSAPKGGAPDEHAERRGGGSAPR